MRVLFWVEIHSSTLLAVLMGGVLMTVTGAAAAASSVCAAVHSNTQNSLVLLCDAILLGQLAACTHFELTQAWEVVGYDHPLHGRMRHPLHVAWAVALAVACNVEACLLDDDKRNRREIALAGVLYKTWNGTPA